MKTKLDAILQQFVGQPINDRTLSQIRGLVQSTLLEDAAKLNIAPPEFVIPNRAEDILRNTITIQPKNLYSAIWAFGRELPPPKSMLANDIKWVSDRTGITYTCENGYATMELPAVLNISESDEFKNFM